MSPLQFFEEPTHHVEGFLLLTLVVQVYVKVLDRVLCLLIHLIALIGEWPYLTFHLVRVSLCPESVVINRFLSNLREWPLVWHYRFQVLLWLHVKCSTSTTNMMGDMALGLALDVNSSVHETLLCWVFLDLKGGFAEMRTERFYLLLWYNLWAFGHL